MGFDNFTDLEQNISNFVYYEKKNAICNFISDKKKMD